MEVGARHDGFCNQLTTDTVGACRSMGYSGPAHKVGTFSSLPDNLHNGEIQPVVYLRDRPSTWSTSIHSVG